MSKTIGSVLSTNKKSFFSYSNRSGYYEATDKAKKDWAVLAIIEQLNIEAITTYKERKYRKWNDKLSINQKKLKEQAIKDARNFYYGTGRTTKEVEFEKFGFDFGYVKGLDKKLIIVKALTHNKESFVITADEIMEALINPEIVIHVVVSPDDEPEHFPYSGREFVNKFKLK